jgi:hypothetical protein
MGLAPRQRLDGPMAEAYDPVDFLDFLAPHGVRWIIETGAQPTQA